MTSRIHARVSGPDAALPMLFMHEIGGSSASFRWLIDELPELRCIALDLPGSGDSAALPGQSTLSDYADAVAAYVREAFAQPVVVVGMAFGSAVGAVLAARHPDAVSALVFGCMGAAIEDHTATFLKQRSERVLREGLAATIETSLAGSFPPLLRVGREVQFDQYQREVARAHVAGYVDMSLALATSGSAIGDALRSVQAPVYLVGGKHDPHFTPAVVQAMTAMIPQLRDVVALEDAGHLAHVQAPGALASVLRDVARNGRRL